ncbi:hypothetical protein [Sphingomonas sp. SORGH_AS_0879]|uniref:hypothetical protein n=1 Tax=Sphingomonas sp. SORGH_AS_0879 TaxID=3041790 RepID=UPI00277DAF14|nr:hypothetical protein [Sphingomonas sp. SORGH_AS_0879]MDQ1229301.1 hypothetical protein [Sphingomonas sp. SORGH_AS_0879]
MADDLPRLDDLPIPDDAKPGRGWTPFMLEMAAHIGATNTLRLVDHFGGQKIYVPIAVEKSPFADVLPTETVETLARVYGREKVEFPTAREALFRARGAPVIAAVREKRLARNDAARILRTSARYISQLANDTDDEPDGRVFVLRRPVDTRQLEMFPDPAAPAPPD